MQAPNLNPPHLFPAALFQFSKKERALWTAAFHKPGTWFSSLLVWGPGIFGRWSTLGRTSLSDIWIMSISFPPSPVRLSVFTMRSATVFWLHWVVQSDTKIFSRFLLPHRLKLIQNPSAGVSTSNEIHLLSCYSITCFSRILLGFLDPHKIPSPLLSYKCCRISKCFSTVLAVLCRDSLKSFICFIHSSTHSLHWASVMYRSGNEEELLLVISMTVNAGGWIGPLVWVTH